jgi:hypothetical protein
MHTLLVIVVVVVGVPFIWLLSPRRGGGVSRRANEWAWRRNADGRGNFMTKPLWGPHANRRSDRDSQ